MQKEIFQNMMVLCGILRIESIITPANWWIFGRGHSLKKDVTFTIKPDANAPGACSSLPQYRYAKVILYHL